MTANPILPLVLKPKNPYTPPKTKECLRRGRAVTVLIGIQCVDGIVLCADRQISAPGIHKYYEQKLYPIQGSGWAVVVGYAGLPALAKEAEGKISKRLKTTTDSVTPESVEQVCDEVLTDLGRLYTPSLDIQLLVAVSGKGYRASLLAFDGKGLHAADGFNCFGVADSSLISYLSGVLYSPDITTEIAETVGIYLVSKAKKYIDHCGGDTDIVVVHENGVFDSPEGPDIWNKELQMDGAESAALLSIIKAGRSSF